MYEGLIYGGFRNKVCRSTKHTPLKSKVPLMGFFFWSNSTDGFKIKVPLYGPRSWYCPSQRTILTVISGTLNESSIWAASYSMYAIDKQTKAHVFDKKKPTCPVINWPKKKWTMCNAKTTCNAMQINQWSSINFDQNMINYQHYYDVNGC